METICRELGCEASEVFGMVLELVAATEELRAARVRAEQEVRAARAESWELMREHLAGEAVDMEFMEAAREFWLDDPWSVNKVLGVEVVKADNPYGCNQYGEGWKEEHLGNSTKYEQTGFSGQKAKMLTNTQNGNRVSVATKEKNPGKGAYPDASEEGLKKAAENKLAIKEKKNGNISTTKQGKKGLDFILKEVEDICTTLINSREYDEIAKRRPQKPSAEAVNALFPSREVIQRWRRGTATSEDLQAIKKHRDAHAEYVEAERKYLKDILAWDAEVKEFGLKAVELPTEEQGSTKFRFLKNWATDKKAKVQESLNDLMRITSKHLTPDFVDVTSTNKTRSFHLDGTVYLSRGFRPDTPAHEVVHGIERLNPEVNARSVDFLLKRGGEEAPEALYYLTGNSGYGSEEFAFKDSFVERGNSAYCGKIYASDEQESFSTKKKRDEFMALPREDKKKRIRTTDLLTMGVERVINNAAEFARTDPEYFKFVLANLRQ